MASYVQNQELKQFPHKSNKGDSKPPQWLQFGSLACRNKNKMVMSGYTSVTTDTRVLVKCK